MKIKEAKFVISNTDPAKCPAPELPEYAFVGRSNVGKSSLINMLCNNNGLAKTSSTPGKTQLINHFLINGEWYLVDLPGYGYAKIGEKHVLNWKKFTQTYLQKRENLMCVFVLVDIRHEPLKNDTDFMEYLAVNGVPFVIVFTKADKLSQTQIKKNVEKYKAVMTKTWEELPQIFVTSSEKKIGGQEILDFIEQTNTLFVK